MNSDRHKCEAYKGFKLSSLGSFKTGEMKPNGTNALHQRKLDGSGNGVSTVCIKKAKMACSNEV